jgi:hypothetical protein
MNSEIGFIAAVPVLASLDIERSVAFFASKLDFTIVYAQPGGYGIVARGAVHIHFWNCEDRRIAEATGCRIQIQQIDALYARCVDEGIVHPNGALKTTQWGNQEFAILDPDSNLVTFFEAVGAQ